MPSLSGQTVRNKIIIWQQRANVVWAILHLLLLGEIKSKSQQVQISSRAINIEFNIYSQSDYWIYACCVAWCWTPDNPKIKGQKLSERCLDQSRDAAVDRITYAAAVASLQPHSDAALARCYRCIAGISRSGRLQMHRQHISEGTPTDALKQSAIINNGEQYCLRGMYERINYICIMEGCR